MEPMDIVAVAFVAVILVVMAPVFIYGVAVWWAYVKEALGEFRK